MFKVGDRVRLKNDQNNRGKGLCGILKRNKEGLYILFDYKTSFGHDADGTETHGFAWYVGFHNLEIEEIPYDPTQVGDTDDDI